MSSAHSPRPVKIVIAGGFGVGKTTAVSRVSELPPLLTEAPMTTIAAAIDDAGQVPGKTTTTVALDFGCVTLDNGTRVYLFGTPGQDRFGFMWTDLTVGALGGLVIVDSRRLDDGYPAIDYFERIEVPFVVAVNLFNGELSHSLADVRWALAVEDHTPLVTFDARDRHSVHDALIAVLRHGMATTAG